MVFIKIELEFSWMVTFPIKLREKGNIKNKMVNKILP